MVEGKGCWLMGRAVQGMKRQEWVNGRDGVKATSLLS